MKLHGPNAIDVSAYPVVALVLQGGGALGSYQAGVIEGLHEAGIQPNWIAGISIGAINAAVMAGNAPSRRVEQLQAFWRHLCRHPQWPGVPVPGPQMSVSDLGRDAYSRLESWRAMTEGQAGFFAPRWWPPLLPGSGSVDTASWYDTRPLRETLERHVDFERLNRPKELRFSVGAVNVATGNFRYFDNTRERIGPEHVMASGALPPGFPAVEVDGEFYWDGGLVSNTPLLHVLFSEPRRDALVFQVDLWSATGPLPASIAETAERQKDIQYSSRTRMITEYLRDEQRLRRQLHALLALVPPARRNTTAYRQAERRACGRRCNVVQLVYRNKRIEGDAKDYSFGLLSLREHWQQGLSDVRDTLSHPQWLDLPDPDTAFATHDLHDAEHARRTGADSEISRSSSDEQRA